jgi:hypothetical protein
MEKKVMNININNYYIQTLKKAKKRTMHTSRAEGKQKLQKYSGDIVREKKPKIHLRRKPKDNKMIKDKVDKILKKYFTSRQKSLRFTLKSKRKSSKKKKGKKQSENEKENYTRKNFKNMIKRTSEQDIRKNFQKNKQKERSLSKRKKFWEMIHKTNNQDESKRGRSLRNGLFEKGIRRSTGMRFDGIFENKKSLGVSFIILLILVANDPQKRNTC